jgi:hypothetical protein
VHLRAADSVQVYDGWGSKMTTLLAYFENFGGDRAAGFGRCHLRNTTILIRTGGLTEILRIYDSDILSNRRTRVPEQVRLEGRDISHGRPLLEVAAEHGLGHHRVSVWCHPCLRQLTSFFRVWVEIMGSQKCRIVWKSQLVLIMTNPIIFTRTRAVEGRRPSHRRLLSGSTPSTEAFARSRGTTDLRMPFPVAPEHTGFALSHRCVPPASGFKLGYGLLGGWWVLAIWCMRRAMMRIRYGAKSGGLWKMNEQELAVIAEAMDIDCDIDGDGAVDKSELIAAITQSPNWPVGVAGRRGGVAALALSSFEHLPTDSDPHEWVDVSCCSLLFLLDVISCCACIWEGFSDFLFAVLQFQRPNDGGVVTGSFALTITAISTLCHLAPPGRGILSSTVFRDVLSYREAKAWVRQHARTEDGKHLRTHADWNLWLHSATGRHRPMGLSAIPNIEYRHTEHPELASLRRRLACQCCRRQIGATQSEQTHFPTAETAWV